MPKWSKSIKKDKRSGVVEPTEMDYARLAAYIDGEGCISTSTAYNKAKNSESVYVIVGVYNTDPRLIDWCLERWGGRAWQTNQKVKRWSTSYGWRVVCQQARTLLENCLPFFIIKREQAEVAIALMKTQRRWGRKGMPDEVKELRWKLRNELSAMKGPASKIKKTKPRVIDYVRNSNYVGKGSPSVQ